jgi:hypothetical protein
MAELSTTTAIQDTGIVVCRSEKATLDLGPADMIGVLPSAGMESTGKKEKEEEAAPPRATDFQRLREAYIADLRAVLGLLRRKLN